MAFIFSMFCFHAIHFQEETKCLNEENGALKLSLEELDVKYREMESKASSEEEVSDQLREQIKKVSKTASKSKKVCIAHESHS